MSGVALSLVSILGLCACEDKEQAAEPKPEQTAEAPTPAAPAPAELSAFDEARDALFDHAVFVLGQRVTSPDTFPEVNTEVKDMLELLQNYYAALQNEPEMPEERARVSLQIAQTICDLGAYAKAYEAYETAAKDIEALPENVRNSRETKRSLSAIAAGKGACLLAQSKASEALEYYKQSLELDMAMLKELHPEDKPIEGETVPPELAAAATGVLDSYRCLGDCQNIAGDPEEARETYRKGMELVQKLRVLAPSMAVSYVKLLIATADLENELGDARKALAGWQQAAELCQGLNQANASLKIKADTKRLHDTLIRPIMQMRARLAEEEKSKSESEPKPEVTTEPIQPVPAAEAPAPVVAPEAEAPKPAAEKPATNRRRNRRNR